MCLNGKDNPTENSSKYCGFHSAYIYRYKKPLLMWKEFVCLLQIPNCRSSVKKWPQFTNKILSSLFFASAAKTSGVAFGDPYYHEVMPEFGTFIQVYVPMLINMLINMLEWALARYDWTPQLISEIFVRGRSDLEIHFWEREKKKGSVQGKWKPPMQWFFYLSLVP